MRGLGDNAGVAVTLFYSLFFISYSHNQRRDHADHARVRSWPEPVPAPRLFSSIRATLEAQPAGRAIVFANTTVVNADAVQNDVALAVVGDKIAAIGPTDQILKSLSERRRLRRPRQGALSRA